MEVLFRTDVDRNRGKKENAALRTSEHRAWLIAEVLGSKIIAVLMASRIFIQKKALGLSSTEETPRPRAQQPIA